MENSPYEQLKEADERFREEVRLKMDCTTSAFLSTVIARMVEVATGGGRVARMDFGPCSEKSKEAIELVKAVLEGEQGVKCFVEVIKGPRAFSGTEYMSIVVTFSF